MPALGAVDAPPAAVAQQRAALDADQRLPAVRPARDLAAGAKRSSSLLPCAPAIGSLRPTRRDGTRRLTGVLE